MNKWTFCGSIVALVVVVSALSAIVTTKIVWDARFQHSVVEPRRDAIAAMEERRRQRAELHEKRKLLIDKLLQEGLSNEKTTETAE